VLIRRYRDGYRVAGFLATFGALVKTAGGVLAAIVVVSALAGANGPLGGASMAFGIIVAAVIGGVFFVCGVIVSSQGQLLQATLDSAVFGSPFLSDSEKASAMGL